MKQWLLFIPLIVLFSCKKAEPVDLQIITLTPTDLPDPVVPATSK